MLHTPPLRNYFLSDRHNRYFCQKRSNALNAARVQVTMMVAMGIRVHEYAWLVIWMRLSGDRTPYSPAKFLYSWWQHAANLASYEQQDAHEFFISMLAGIHEKVGKDRRKPHSQGNGECRIAHRVFSAAAMVEDMCFFNKDFLVIKAPKKSLMLLRTSVLIFSMVIGVFICTVCLNQISSHARTKFLEIHVVDKPSQSIMKLTDIRHLHYPKPVSFSRDEYTHNPVKFFAILSNQRSATLDKVYNLDWLSSASKNQCSAAVGLKWLLNQGVMEHHEEIVDYFNRRRVFVIFPLRRNLLHRMVSTLANSYDRHAKLFNGTHKSHVHSSEEADTLSKYKPTINSTSLLTELKDMETRSAKALEYFNTTQHMILYYEDLMRNRTKLKDARDFLGLPPMELTSRQVKIHRGPLSDHSKNWDDVSRTLRGTPYESFLESDY
ncbi:hypothetical protein L6164_027809 [Bauhinia variegata]|uniref:Uncharacterized protein n=1 Tax=Bauhinia variegata TaxID=167791 RepID=A0ACB9LUI4_BAUVA|nr:hypothetical protein L6164_027809 [Bauhinia variegata]